MAKTSARIPRLRVARIQGSFSGYKELSARGTRVGRQISDALNNVFDQFEGASEDVMLYAMGPTFDKSQDLVPVDTGDLKDSGYLEKTGTPAKPSIQIGYGAGGSPDYTVLVHEDLEMRHRAPAQAKFLQQPVLEDLESIYARLGEGYELFMGPEAKGS